MIHGAVGGVGHFAVQIAKYMGAYVIGTSSSKNRDFVLSLGADKHIDYTKEDFEKELHDIDFVLETTGHKNFLRSVQVLKKEGTIVNLPSGLTKEDKKAALLKELKACFFMSVFSDGEGMKIISDLLRNHIIKSYIFKEYSFDEMKKAHLQIESGHTVGKVVVNI